MPGAEKTIDQWSAEAHFAVIVETTTLSDAGIAEYCRKKGLYPEQIIYWKQCVIQTENPGDKVALKQSQKEIKLLKKELLRKEKVLTEEAAYWCCEKSSRITAAKPTETTGPRKVSDSSLFSG